MSAGPVKKVDPEQVARLAGEGMGRNAVARHLQVSRRAVDEAAREARVAWDRTRTAAATAARLADVRADLAELFADAADLAGDRLLEALRAEALDPTTVRALATVAGISADKLLALADRVAPVDDDGTSLLDQLRAGVDEWHENLNTNPELSP